MVLRIFCTNKCSFSHGTLLVLVWAVLSYAAFNHILGVSPLLPIPNEVQFGLKIVCGSLSLLMPVAGWWEILGLEGTELSFLDPCFQ